MSPGGRCLYSTDVHVNIKYCVLSLSCLGSGPVGPCPELEGTYGDRVALLQM